jgi:hypothetical protein
MYKSGFYFSVNTLLLITKTLRLGSSRKEMLAVCFASWRGEKERSYRLRDKQGEVMP